MSSTGFGGFPLEHGPREGESIVFLHGGSMAGWTWAPQVEGLPGRHLLTPDLPGFGAKAGQAWPGAAGAADSVAELIREHAIGGRAHLVGLSTGGYVAAELVERHPDLVRSCLISGSALAGYSRLETLVVKAQLPFWTARWYWGALASAFGVPAADRPLFADTATAPSPATNRALVENCCTGILDGMRFDYPGPVLAVAAERDVPSVRRAFAPLRARLPQLQTWIAPKVHHAWSSENPELFNEMVAGFVDTGSWPLP